MLNIIAGWKARIVAKQFCKSLHPKEPLLGSCVAAVERDRIVVRVFYGRYECSIDAPLIDKPFFIAGYYQRIPAWRNCLIVAVDKLTMTAAKASNSAKYRP